MVLLRDLEGISLKILPKGSKDLEMNHLIKRTICDTKPVTVEYELTELGCSFSKVLKEIADWGIAYRNTIIANILNLL